MDEWLRVLTRWFMDVAFPFGFLCAAIPSYTCISG